MKNLTNQFLITFSFAILHCIPVSSQTNISGFISSNTTWDLAGSPYIVVGNALVSAGYTLTIEPGVVVKFDTDKALQIDGELIAIGSPGNRITFTSNQASPAAGDWAKLHFSDLCSDAAIDASGNYISGTIMKYCNVIYAGGLGYGAIDVEQSSPYFSQCKILNSSASGIYYNCSHAVIDSSSIKNCTGFGIFFQTEHYSMYNDSIINNLSGGINMLQQNNTIQSKVINCYFASNNSAISWSNNGVNNTLISGNYFINNYGTVVDLLGHYDTLTCNKFINNQNGPAIHWGDNYNPISGGLIFNNLFEGNMNPTGPSVILAGAGYSVGYGDTLIFANNIVRNNSSLGGSCCEFNMYLLNFTNLQCLRISDNIFTNNTGSNFIKMLGDQNSNASYDFLFMRNNTFLNPSCQYELYNDIPYGAPNLYLDLNYWGSTSTQHVDSVIYDYFDFANQSVVYYLPILTSPVVIDTACSTIFEIGINNIESSHYSMKLFPNPAISYFTIAFNHIINKGFIEIYNMVGEKFFEDNIYDKSEIEINVGNILPGIYFVKFYDGENYYSRKIIIEHD